jgi:putative spermidine/putrescine transport system substrate-binding protein
MKESPITRRQFLMTAAVASLTAACGAPAAQAPKATDVPKAAEVKPTEAPPAASGMDALIAAAKKEGELSVMALPHDWANYGEMIEGFKKKYGLKINEINPDAGSADEIEAIKANKDNKGPQAPDVIDVAFTFGGSAKKDGLIQPYKVSTWDSIPAALKDADGFWYGDYYGVLTFEVNADVVKTLPQDWNDLLKPEYKGQVALAGDPRKSGQAISAVYAAALANGGSLDDASPGLAWFDKLNKAGNFVPVIAKPATIAKGETPIAIRWDYNALANRDTSAGNPKIEVIVPKSGVLAGVYVQAISAYAPHPNAAKLWMEYLYSDEGQLIWLKGYAHPIRFDDMVKRNVIPAELMGKLPSPESYKAAAYPTADQLASSKKTITEGWDKLVGANVQ